MLQGSSRTSSMWQEESYERTRSSVLGRLPDPVPLESFCALGPLLPLHLPDVAALGAFPRLALLRPPGRSSHRGCAVVLVHKRSLRREAVESWRPRPESRQPRRREEVHHLAEVWQLELDSRHHPRDWEPGFWVPKDRGEEIAAGRDAGGATPVGHGDGAGFGGAEQRPEGSAEQVASQRDRTRRKRKDDWPMGKAKPARLGESIEPAGMTTWVRDD